MVRKETQTVLPVPRTKEEAKRLYDRISRLYEYLAGLERKYAEMALDRLSVKEGETVLEIGFGSGHCFKRIAELVGEGGKACGLDISSGMLEVTRVRLGQAGLIDRIELYQGDAANLPFRDNAFDAVFTSFTLELFDTPEIPKVLQEIRRALRPKGKLGVIDASKENGSSLSMRLYEWAHMKWPKYIDCRPIYVERSLKEAGYEIVCKETVRFFGLSGEIVIALNAK